MRQASKFTKFLLVMVAVGLMLGAGFPRAEAAKNAPVRMIPQNFSDLADTVSPAVVHIKVEKTVKASGRSSGSSGQNPFGGNKQFKDFFGRHFGEQRQPEFKQPGQGSGFIIEKSGYIVTNNHVVEGADEIKVVLKDETQYDAVVVGLDPVTDIALIKVDPKKSLPTVQLGSSADLRVGEWVAAIGSPFGLEYTVTAGIVSAKGRVIGSGPYDDFIQTDASINPGNSGGPLINMQGEVVGINTMIIAGGQGIGFAIPVDQVKGIVSQLKSDGEVTRGWLGVTIQDLKGDLAQYYGVDGKSGVMVVDVVPGDPADKGGVKPKDIITIVNGKRINTSRDLTNLAANLVVGDTANVTILRDGKHKTLHVKIGKRPLTMAAASQNQHEQKDSEYGFEVTELTPEIARRLNIKETAGVIVVGVAPNSKADAAGVKQGDLIIEVNRKNVDSVKDFKSLLDQYKDGDGISLLVQRMNAGLMVIRLA
ncbi:HtrA protease/chaperone protein [Olavius sp. associated proteobacterium Delta 1]|nr:HtrA protease/chaperone protein [Olavius sp. associated proteobacterium Delta 1]